MLFMVLVKCESLKVVRRL